MNENEYLTDGVKITKLNSFTASGTGDVNSITAVDMEADGGYDGVAFIGAFGTADPTNALKAQQSSDNGVSDDFTDLAGSKTVSGTGYDVLIVDIQRPQKRYVRPYFLRGASSTVEAVWALQYKGRDLPSVNTIASQQLLNQLSSPAEGTA